MKETEVTNNNTQIYPEESRENSSVLKKNSGEAAFVKLPKTKVISQESVSKYSDSESAWQENFWGEGTIPPWVEENFPSMSLVAPQLAIKEINRLPFTCILHVKSSKQNNILTLTDLEGNAFATQSTGSLKDFQGPKKRSPLAIQEAARILAQEAENLGMKYIHIKYKGTQVRRKIGFVSKGLKSSSLKTLSYYYAYAFPHGGARAKKRRRL